MTARLKICPEIRYRVYFKGLKVEEVRRKYLLVGQREVDVKGRIKRKLLNDFKDYSEAIRRDLLEALRQRLRKGATSIPIRKDYPAQQVVEILQEYAISAEDS